MPAFGPGDPPPVVVRRKRRVRRRDRQQARQTRQAHAQESAYVSQGKAVEHVARQQQAVARKPRVVRTGGDTKADVHAGEDFKRTKQYRGAVVGAYSQLSGHEKHQRVSQAASRVKHGTATEADHAILHIHRTRVAGNRKVARAVAAYNAITGTTAHDVAFPPVAPRGARVKRREDDVGIGDKIAGAIRAVGKASSKGYASVHAPKVLVNAPKDIAEIAVTTPSSIAKLGSDIVHHPERVPGELAAPYVELAKHPGKFIESHPVSAALMVAPVGRVPGRAAGKVARVAGKQTLERPAAEFAGTNLKQARTGSRGVVTRAVQSSRDKRRGAPQMTEAQVGRRVDEFYDASKAHVRRVEQSAARQAQERQLTADAAAERVRKARKGARKQVDRRFAREFGGEVHPTREAAQAAQDALPFEPRVMKVAKGQYTNVPEFAADRLRHHRSVGTSKAVGAKVFRTSRRMFTQAVLPVSPRWLAGQGIEAGFRSAVAGAGPASLIREARVVRKLEAETPGAGKEFRARTSGGGQFGLSSTAREFAEERMTLADVFKGTPLAKPAGAATRVGRVPGIRHVRDGYNEYSRIVFDTVNGTIEQTARRAMTGKAIKTSPLMERHVLGLTDKAIADAAAGARATESQVALGRAVDRMYGQYSKFSPHKRETLLHTTPFYPWYRNTAEFLFKVLPKDHPVTAALTADLDAATEDWRKAHGLSLRGGERVPDFLLGRAPAGKGFAPIGRYLPFAPSDVAGSAAELVLPQFSGPLLNLRGVEWTGKRLKGKPIPAAALTAAETYTPGLAQSNRITGVSRVVRKSGREGVLQGAKPAEALRAEFDPFVATKPPKVRRRKRRVRRKAPLSLSGPETNPLLELP